MFKLADTVKERLKVKTFKDECTEKFMFMLPLGSTRPSLICSERVAIEER